MPQRDIVVPLPGPKHHPKLYLEKYGFIRPLRRVYRGRIIFFLTLGLALCAAWLTEDYLPPGYKLNGGDAATAVAALGALALGYQQWREAKHESSMEKYYERLDMANHRQDPAHKSVHEMMSPCLPEVVDESPEELLYVYAELDNLEYVVEKYKLGYMKAKLACRGLRTFQLRCWSPKFRSIARHRVHAGDYNPRTAKVVDRICEEIGRLENFQYTTVTEPREWPPRRRASDPPQAGGDSGLADPKAGGGEGRT